MTSFTPEQNKKLVEIYPYLMPRNVWTDEVLEDYDYSYIVGQHELPEGWLRLFLLYCKAIRPLLVDSNQIEKFRFSQVKEKYGSMRLYSFCYPEEMRDVEWLYSGYSEFVCQRCGRMAKMSTIGWIEQLCLDCYGSLKDNRTAEAVVKHRTMKIGRYTPDGMKTIVLSYREVNKEYMKCIKMSDEQFFRYITRRDNYVKEKH